MPSNVEVKARARDWEAQLGIAAAGAVANVLEQTDTFFNVPRGRLKLRELKGAAAYLIYYERPDQGEAKLSEYYTAPAPNPAALLDVLKRAYGSTKVVRKRRQLFLHGQTRLHFDEVEGLGRFIEIEVCLQPGQTEAEGRQIAASWVAKLQIQASDLVEGAYADILPARP